MMEVSRWRLYVKSCRKVKTRNPPEGEDIGLSLNRLADPQANNLEPKHSQRNELTTSDYHIQFDVPIRPACITLLQWA